jgi:hypothetical protein
MIDPILDLPRAPILSRETGLVGFWFKTFASQLMSSDHPQTQHLKLLNRSQQLRCLVVSLSWSKSRRIPTCVDY